jgi:signal transduction histidine kinase
MMNNSFFFYFVVCITCAIFAIGYLMVQMLNAHVHKMLDDMTKTFDSILKGTISVVGKDFFELLSKNLCETLSARCVYIGELSGKSQLLKPVVTWKDGALHTAPDLSIQISLVTDLISQDILIVDTKACEKYADSTLLQSCKADVLICSTLHDAKGKPIGILCLLHDDILPNRYLVDPLISIFASRAASELERKITEEKQKYIEMQLAQAHKMEAIGQLVSGISHDFNNMLSAMIGYAQLLYNRLEPESPLRRFAEHILNAGNCNADLITKLTQFARRGTPHLAPVDIHKAIEDAIILLERTVDKSICIVKNLDAVQSTSLGDHTLIQNLFMNMGINARDAMDNKQGILTFSTSVSELKEQSVQCQTFNIPPGHYIAVSITDNGSGMSEETLGHLFEPFYTTKPKGKGTGLGLSNVWGYVENYKGAIDVKSKLGTGTTFTIYFPVVETQDTQPSKSFKATPQPLSIKNILVADDEPAMRDITKAQLEQSGFSVVAFENGALALEYCKKK